MKVSLLDQCLSFLSKNYTLKEFFDMVSQVVSKLHQIESQTTLR